MLLIASKEFQFSYLEFIPIIPGRAPLAQKFHRFSIILYSNLGTVVAIPKPSSVFRGVLWVIVLFEYPTSFQLQCLDWPLNISLKNVLIFGGIHSSFHSHNISCAPSCHTTLKHNGSTSMLHSWHTLFCPNIPYLVLSVQSTLFQKASGFSMFFCCCILQKA